MSKLTLILFALSLVGLAWSVVEPTPYAVVYNLIIFTLAGINFTRIN